MCEEHNRSHEWAFISITEKKRERRKQEAKPRGTKPPKKKQSEEKKWCFVNEKHRVDPPQSVSVTAL